MPSASVFPLPAIRRALGRLTVTLVFFIPQSAAGQEEASVDSLPEGERPAPCGPLC
jgi:hypothetical protein